MGRHPILTIQLIKNRDMKIYQEYPDGDTEPKYQIGDLLRGTEIVVCGLMTTSNGIHRYFLQVSPDSSLVVDEEDIETIIFLLTNKNQPT